MTHRPDDHPPTVRAAALLDKVEAGVASIAARAAALDAAGAYPEADMAWLRDEGVLAAPLPSRLGGLGAGTEPEGTGLIRALLQRLGRANLSVARLFEAHVNALRLIDRFAEPEQRSKAAADVFAGHVFGLWVTDVPGRPALRMERERLVGAKGPASGAGHCSRALVTVSCDDGVRMAVLALTGTERVAAVVGMQGMRAASSGTVALDGAEILFWLGQPGDYLREPDFSCGAWRGSAAAAGALDALVAEVGLALRKRGQADAPMQLARFGQLLIAQGTAGFWTQHAADIAEAAHRDPAEQVAAVNLARIAVESACLDGLRLAQRSLGLAAFVAPHPVDRIARDLGTYLRQPAPDMVLLEAAAWALAQG